MLTLQVTNAYDAKKNAFVDTDTSIAKDEERLGKLRKELSEIEVKMP